MLNKLGKAPRMARLLAQAQRHANCASHGGSHYDHSGDDDSPSNRYRRYSYSVAKPRSDRLMPKMFHRSVKADGQKVFLATPVTEKPDPGYTFALFESSAALSAAGIAADAVEYFGVQGGHKVAAYDGTT